MRVIIQILCMITVFQGCSLGEEAEEKVTSIPEEILSPDDKKETIVVKIEDFERIKSENRELKAQIDNITLDHRVNLVTEFNKGKAVCEKSMIDNFSKEKQDLVERFDRAISKPLKRLELLRSLSAKVYGKCKAYMVNKSTWNYDVQGACMNIISKQLDNEAEVTAISGSSPYMRTLGILAMECRLGRSKINLQLEKCDDRLVTQISNIIRRAP